MEIKRKDPLGSRSGPKLRPLSGFSNWHQDMLKILNRMSQNGASDLALVVMINYCKRREANARKHRSSVRES